jgi:hypothetical protein
VAKVEDRVYGRPNELIYGPLGSIGASRVHLGFYRSLRSLRVFLGVSAFATALAHTLALPTLLS